MVRRLPARHVLAIMLLTVGMASANTASLELDEGLASPQRIGTTELRWFGIKLYRADLYTERGAQFDWSRPFRLDLTYSREFASDALVKATLVELNRIESERPDHDEIAEKLRRCFRDVRTSDTLSAVAKNRNAVRLFLNGEATCTLIHDNIRERFLGIWLSENSRKVSASKALRGLN